MSAFFIAVQGVNIESKDGLNSDRTSSSSFFVNWSWRERDVGLSHKSSACSRSSPQGQADWPFKSVLPTTLSFLAYDWKPPDNYSLLEDGDLMNFTFDVYCKVKKQGGMCVKLSLRISDLLMEPSQWCLSDCCSHRCSNYTIVLRSNGFGDGWLSLLQKS